MIRHKLEQVQEGALGVEPPADGDPEVFLGQLALVILSRTREDPDFARLLLHSELRGSSFAKVFRDVHSEKAIWHLSSYLRKCADDGALADVDPDVAAWSFLGMVWQYALSAYVFEDPMVPDRQEEDLAATFVRIFLDGMRRLPSKRKSKSKQR